MRTKPSNPSAIAELDPEMLAIIEALAAAIIRIKAHDAEKKATVERTAKIALASMKAAPAQTAHHSNDEQLSGHFSGPKLLRIADVAERLSMSRGTIYRKIQEGTFPQPKKLGHSVRWLATDTEAWIDDLSE